MAFFKYPYSSYEKINLDWMLRKIKALEPAIPIVEQSAAIVEDVQETAQEAAAAAESAQQAVATVTALAEQANETAEEAKEIATQAASATIADGSVGWSKLGADVKQVIEGNVSRSTTAQTTANNAQTAADSAQQTANAAQNTANAARVSANNAQTAANNAQTTANNALNKAQWKYLKTLTASGAMATVPTEAREVRLEAFNFDLTPVLRAEQTIEINVPNDDSAVIISAGTIEVYAVISATNKTIVFDPNGTITGNVRLRVCYK